MTHENPWPIPSFTCSLNFANCRLRTGTFTKHLTSSLKFLTTSKPEVKMDNKSNSGSFDDISGDESDALNDLQSLKHDTFWTNCNTHQICALGTGDNDDDEPCFDMSPDSPNDSEIVVSPPVPLLPLIDTSSSKRERIGSYGSTDLHEPQTTDKSEEIPQLLSTVSSNLTIMIGRDVPLCLDPEVQPNCEGGLCVSSASIILNGQDDSAKCGEVSIEKKDPPQVNVRTSDDDSIFNVSENRMRDFLLLDQNNETGADVNKHMNRGGEGASDRNNQSFSDADEENLDDGSRIVLQRSTSLKTCKTPPGTPNRKKIVRFADAMGLDLEAVKQITQEDLPQVPKSAYEDLELPDLFDSPADSPVGSYTSSHMPNVRKFYVPFEPSRFSQLTISDTGGVKNLQTLFTVPGIMPNFLDRVMGTKVCLQKVTVSELSISCIVSVANIHYEKNVIARFTTNEWASFDDMNANYCQGSSAEGTDQFSFTIYVPYLSIGQRLCFALRYTAGGQEYWDNNFGSNYCFKCQSEYSDSQTEDQNGWLHFL